MAEKLKPKLVPPGGEIQRRDRFYQVATARFWKVMGYDGSRTYSLVATDNGEVLNLRHGTLLHTSAWVYLGSSDDA